MGFDCISSWSLLIFLLYSNVFSYTCYVRRSNWNKHICTKITGQKINRGQKRHNHINVCTEHVSHDTTKPTKWLCARRRFRSAWASAQFDQSLRCPHEESLGPSLPIKRTAKILIRLGECPGWSKSSLGAQSFCWFYHIAVHFSDKAYVKHKQLFLSSQVNYIINDVRISWVISAVRRSLSLDNHWRPSADYFSHNQ